MHDDASLTHFYALFCSHKWGKHTYGGKRRIVGDWNRSRRWVDKSKTHQTIFAWSDAGGVCSDVLYWYVRTLLRTAIRLRKLTRCSRIVASNQFEKRTIWPPKHYYQTKPFLERRETFHLRPNSMKEHWIYVCDHEISHKIRKVASYAHGNQKISFVDEKLDLLQSSRILSNKIFIYGFKWRYHVMAK